MLQAFLRLVVISIASIILLVFALLAVRWAGKSQNFAHPPHPWFEQEKWSIYAPPIEQLCDHSFAAEPDWIVEIPVEIAENAWVLPCSQPVPVAKWLANTQHRNWLLRIDATDSSGLDNLVDNVGSFDKDMRFAVITRSQRALRFLRKKAPQWLYAADSASLLRLQIFESLWIETAMDFWPDFVIIGTQAELPLLRPRAAHELERRDKRIIFAKATIEQTPPDFPIHGILTTRPSDLTSEGLRK